MNKNPNLLIKYLMLIIVILISSLTMISVVNSSTYNLHSDTFNLTLVIDSNAVQTNGYYNLLLNNPSKQILDINILDAQNNLVENVARCEGTCAHRYYYDELNTDLLVELIDIDGNVVEVVPLKDNGGNYVFEGEELNDDGEIYEPDKIIIFNTSASWTVPEGVTNITIEAWGAGGAGGSLSGGGVIGRAGGGGAGAYAKSNITVVPGEIYSIVVGAGGTPTNTNGNAGADTTFNSTLVVAKGGMGGSSSGAGGMGGSDIESIGDITYVGGNGGTASATYSGAGGGSAGSSGAGGDANVEIPGVGTSEFGGDGGAGITLEGSGNSGINYGGAGSGAIKTSSANTLHSGGNGAQGLLRISYDEEEVTVILNVTTSSQKEIRGKLELLDNYTSINKIKNDTLENITTLPQLKINYGRLKQAAVVDLISADTLIKQIRFKDLIIEEDMNLSLENVPSENVPEMFDSVVAIDPSKLNFTEAQVLINATSEWLYKCKDWNFTTQTCPEVTKTCTGTIKEDTVCEQHGGWEKVQKMVPGEDYLVILTPADPAYAQYNTTYTAPYCGDTAESPCIVDSDLLKSTDNIAGTSEPNQPNTIDTCADGTSGTYGTDEYIENITITDLNGTNFKAGNTVRVDAWVHCYSAPASDNIQIAYTSNANSPSWTIKAFTDPCPAGGYNNISKTFVLDDVVGKHAVRAIIEYNGNTANTCGIAGYSDSDDVVFNVKAQNTPPSTPTSITCNEGSCDSTFSGSVNLECSGSTDDDADTINYYVEANYSNTFNKNVDDSVNQFVGISGGTSIDLNFTEDWETSPYNWTTTGRYTVSTTVKRSGTYSLLYTGANPAGTYYSTYGTNLDLSSSDSANVSGWIYADLGSTGAYCCLDISSDGGTNWDLGATGTSECAGATTNRNWVEYTHTLTSGQLTNQVIPRIRCYSGRNTRYYLDDINVFGIHSLTSSTESNSTAINYNNVDTNYSEINNISIIVEVDSYNPSGSVANSNNDPDLNLEIYNGSSWIDIGTFNLPSTYTGTGLQTTNYNFTLSTTNSAILNSWKNIDNQDFRIKAIYIDANSTNIDEINYTKVWTSIDGIKFEVLGNHVDGNYLTWDLTDVDEQLDVELRCTAIDLAGSNTNSSYYQSPDTMDIGEINGTYTYLLSPSKGITVDYTDVNFSCRAVTNETLTNITFYWDYDGTWISNGTVSASGTDQTEIFERNNLANKIITWNCLTCDDNNECVYGHTNYTVEIAAGYQNKILTPEVKSVKSGTASNTSVKIGVPENTADGDLLIAIMVTNRSSGTLTAPAGWTALTDSISSGPTAGQTSRAWYKIASSEPDYYNFTSNVAQQTVISITRIINADLDDPIETISTATGTSTTPTAPTINTAQNNSVVLRYMGAYFNSITTNRGYPTGHTGLFLRSSGWRLNDFSSSGVAHKTQESAGATGTAEFSLTASQPWSAGTIAINPRSVPDYDIIVGSIGSQNATISLNSTNNYIGGAFTITSTNKRPANITSITLTEYGSIETLGVLKNIKLVYDLDDTAPYDCSGESYNGDESQYGSTISAFTSQDFKAKFTDDIKIFNESVMCAYVVLDVGEGARDGDTIDFQIENPLTEVIVYGGEANSSTPVELSGITTVSKGISQAGYLWRNDDGGKNEAWNLDDWSYRKKIEFTPNTIKIPKTLYNFTVLINLSDAELRTTSDGGYVQNSNGWDIIFADSDQFTILDHELEFYNSSGSSADLVAWVKVPELKLGGYIYMYYGKSDVTENPSKKTAWDDYFSVIQHFNENTGTLYDSTSNGNNGTVVGANQSVSGKIGNAIEFDGINDYVTLGTDSSLDISGDIAIEAWAKKAPAKPKDIAEYEPMESVLIRYPFAIPYSLIAAFSENVIVRTIVASEAEATTVAGLYSSNGVSCANGCEYVIHPSNFFWTRDFGPTAYWDENEKIKTFDYTYNRERADDNNIPQYYGSIYDVPTDFIGLVHTGGNWMSDGYGTIITSTQILTDNPNLVESEVNEEVSRIIGTHTWYKTTDSPDGSTIRHIDTWAKLVAPDKIVIAEGGPYPTNLTAWATYFANTAISAYGTNYNVSRVPYGYANAVILNNNVFIPQFSNATDATAITAWQNAMPGYNVTGYAYAPGTNNFLTDDAVHCRSKELPLRSAWNFDYIISKGKDAYELQMNRVGNKLSGYITNENISVNVTDQEEWQHYALSFNGTHKKLFINGVLEYEFEDTTTVGTNSQPLTIGGLTPNASDPFWGTLTDGGYFDGIIDEVRVSSAPRCNEWIRTTYHNLLDPSEFYNVEEQENLTSGATRKANENTPTTVNVSENIRLRLLVKNTGDAIEDMNFRLQVAPLGDFGTCENVSSTNFTEVPASNNCGTSLACMSDSTYIVGSPQENQEPTTQKIISVFGVLLERVNGKFVDNESNQSDNITLEQNRYTTIEYVFQFTPYAQGDTTYCFRTTDKETPLDNYDEVAQVTTAMFDSQIHLHSLGCYPNITSLGESVICNASVESSSVDEVLANVTLPNSTIISANVFNISDNYYFEFSETLIRGLYNVSWFANNTYEISDTNVDNFTIGDIPSVDIIHPLEGHYPYNFNYPVALVANITDEDGLVSSYVNVTLPNSTVETLVMGEYPVEDNFDTDTEGYYWTVKATSIQPSQTCIADIDKTVDGKAYIEISGDGSPLSNTYCSLISISPFYGDFDMNVSFNITHEFGENYGMNLVVSERPSSNKPGRFGLISLGSWAGYGRTYYTYVDDGNVSDYFSGRASDDTEGKLRVKREGNTLTFYSWNNSANEWFEESIAEDLNLSCSLFITLETENAANDWGEISVEFDNAQISVPDYYATTFFNTSLEGQYNATFFAVDSLGLLNDSENITFNISFVNQKPSVPYILYPGPDEIINGTYEILWSDVYDHEDNNVQFNITLLNEDESFNYSIITNYGNLSTNKYSWDTTEVVDGTYSLRIDVFENDTTEKWTTYNQMDGTFEINNSINSWQTYYGNLFANISLDDGSLIVKTWENVEDANIYIADSNAIINWNTLKAITRTVDEVFHDDFSQVDLALNLTGTNNTISSKFSTNGINPISTTSMMIYETLVENIPTINSTNSSNFNTSILWDYSTDTNEYFDTIENEPLIFATVMNKNGIGMYGTYDYEIIVPYTLQEQFGIDNSLALYIEIK